MYTKTLPWSNQTPKHCKHFSMVLSQPQSNTLESAQEAVLALHIDETIEVCSKIANYIFEHKNFSFA